MKKLFSDLLIPTLISVILLVLMSASFKADRLITNSRNIFIAAMLNNDGKLNSKLIIDAGHGGVDGGAVSITGGKESEINLQIAKKADLLAAFFGINTVMTRADESIEYPEITETIHDKKVYDSKRRIDIINNTSNATLVSIHQNHFDDSSVIGAQIFYNSFENSSILADFVSTNLKEFAEKVRTPQKISDNIYIFRYAKCPSILIECGFISNEHENSLLINNNYQIKTSLAVIIGFLQYENLAEQSVGGMIYES